VNERHHKKISRLILYAFARNICLQRKPLPDRGLLLKTTLLIVSGIHCKAEPLKDFPFDVSLKMFASARYTCGAKVFSARKQVLKEAAQNICETETSLAIRRANIYWNFSATFLLLCVVLFVQVTTVVT
jgi:hypothetical protein